MKAMIVAAFWMVLAGSVHADTFELGDRAIVVPAPQHHTRVTDRMVAVHRLAANMADPMNEQLAFYIPDPHVPAALAGEMPPISRYFLLKASRTLMDKVVSAPAFARIRDQAKRENRTILESAMAKASNAVAQTGRNLGTAFDVDLALKISTMVPLDPHEETEVVLAHSMYVKVQVASEGSTEEVPLAVTSEIVNVAGKVVFLYCYAPQAEMEWTRSAAKAWADAVVAGNPPPPKGGLDWGQVLRSGLIGGAIGGIGALFLRKRKKAAPATR